MVSVTPLGTDTRRRIGLLPPDVTGLPPSLWTDSEPAQLQRLLPGAMGQRLPAAQELLLTVLLAEADDLPRPDDAMAWLIARIDALIELGAVEPALSMIAAAEPTRDKDLFARWMTLSLLAGEERAPCGALALRPDLSPDEATRIFCLARMGDFETAALLFGTTGALDVLGAERETLLAHFLDPELFADEPLPRAPLRPDALTFRLFAAAGEPLPTAPLPRAFAHTDLSDAAGWKAQIEAAERLARAGVLPANRLLGLYTNRAPAASGGIWDRVAAVQDFDRALSAGNAAQVAETLPPVWRSMQSAGLETVFADLFAADLAKLSLNGPARNIAWRVVLLSRESAEADLPHDMPAPLMFLASLAQGQPDADLAQTDTGRAVVDGFAPQADRSLPPGQSGEEILKVLARLSEAGRGDLSALTSALRTLRALGLEPVARQVALQSLIIRARE
ncbi:hypothetical protein E4Z66_04560 [Aliishimia ponticola]|uniref:Uncharacterized protein n=1 Tax=Aliishimia ponticola TaxID=2499833 RepID=A0A4S4NGP9_9RHOB|nr:hypothetical protein [Aliishimia ponticola]THH38834.1 hypothetical protein E4Z66_04560 [Aliishimia ponticola]